MKSFSLQIHKMVTEAIAIISSRQKLKQIIATPLYRNALYLMLNTVVTSLVGFFFWIAVARFYSETEVGFGSAAISAINLLTLLSMVGLNFCVIRFLPQAKRPQEFINTSFTLTGVISLVTAGIFIAGLNIWAPSLSFIRHDAIFSLTFLGTVMLSTLSNLTDSVFIARRSAGFMLSKNTIFSLLKILLVIALAVFLHTFGVVVSWGIAYGIALALSLFLFLPRIVDGYKPVPTLERAQIKGIVQYSGFSYLDSLLSGASILILPLMVLNLLGTESNAHFYAVWMIANLLFSIPYSVSQSLFAEGSHSEASFKENVVRSIKFTFLFLIPIAIVLILVAKWVLLAFGQGYAASGLTLLWILILSSLPRGINYIYVSLLRVQGKLKELVIIRSFMTVAVLIPCFFMLPGYGIISIGYVWLAVQGVVAIVLIARLLAQRNQIVTPQEMI